MRIRYLMGVAWAAFMSSVPVCAAAQSVATRSPNLLGGWVAPKGVIQLNFLHRFTLSDPPLRKITNTPTFNVGTGIANNLMVGFVFGSNSTLVPAYPNEWEFYARALPLAESRGAPVDVSVQGGYNVASESVDGEIFVGRDFGRVRLLAAGRVFSRAFDSTATRLAVTGGAVVRLTPSISLAGDYGTLLDRTSAEKIAWSAGLQMGVPYTPHSFSIQAANVGTASLEGVSRGGRTRWGFEYTIPITLRRYMPVHTGGADAEESTATRLVGPSTAPPSVRRPHGPFVASALDGAVPAVSRAALDARPSMQPPVAASDTQYVDIRNLAYDKPKLEITTGTTVVWRNLDPIQHSVIATDGTFDSGLIDPKGRFAVTFTEVGEHAYHCMPHPFMQGRVTVKNAQVDNHDRGGAREENR